MAKLALYSPENVDVKNPLYFYNALCKHYNYEPSNAKQVRYAKINRRDYIKIREVYQEMHDFLLRASVERSPVTLDGGFKLLDSL